MTHSHKCQCGERCRPRCGATTEALVPSSRFESCSSSLLLNVLKLLLWVRFCKWTFDIIRNLMVRQHLLSEKGNWYILTGLETDASVNIETRYSALSHTHWPIYPNRTQYTEYRRAWCFCLRKHMNAINHAHRLRAADPVFSSAGRGTEKKTWPQRAAIGSVWNCSFVRRSVGKTVPHLNQGPKWQTLARQCEERDRQLLWGSVVFSR